MSEQTQTYWLTRDADEDGNLSPLVDVWLTPPSRKNLPGDKGCIWLDSSVTGIESRHTQWTTAAAAAYTPSHVIPDTSRECVRVG